MDILDRKYISNCHQLSNIIALLSWHFSMADGKYLLIEYFRLLLLQLLQTELTIIKYIYFCSIGMGLESQLVNLLTF